MSLFSVFFSECHQSFVNFINHFKEPALCCLKFCIVFLFFIAFNSALILIVYFLSQSSPECMPIEGERERGIRRKRGTHRRERNTDLLLPLCALSADCTHNGGMYLDWESNPCHFAVQDNTPTYLATQAGALYLCYVSFILLTLGSCSFPFCRSSRHYIRLVTRDFLFLDVSLPVMMKLLSYYHVLRNPQV